MKYLLDSVILIDHLNRIEAASDLLRRHGRDLAVSAVTRAEVLAGLDEDGAVLGAALLDQFPFLPMDAAIADEAARFRRRTRLKLADAVQAATAVRHNLKLMTRNTKDFSAAKFPFVVVPYRVA